MTWRAIVNDYPILFALLTLFIAPSCVNIQFTQSDQNILEHAAILQPELFWGGKFSLIQFAVLWIICPKFYYSTCLFYLWFTCRIFCKLVWRHALAHIRNYIPVGFTGIRCCMSRHERCHSSSTLFSRQGASSTNSFDVMGGRRAIRGTICGYYRIA